MTILAFVLAKFLPLCIQQSCLTSIVGFCRFLNSFIYPFADLFWKLLAHQRAVSQCCQNLEVVFKTSTLVLKEAMLKQSLMWLLL